MSGGYGRGASERRWSRRTLLKGAGLALTNDVRATPTYMVNGTLVEAGDEGKNLTEYLEKLVK